MSGRFMLLLFNDPELIDSLFCGKNCFVKCPLPHVCLVLLLNCIFDAKDGSDDHHSACSLSLHSPIQFFVLLLHVCCDNQSKVPRPGMFLTFSDQHTVDGSYLALSLVNIPIIDSKRFVQQNLSAVSTLILRLFASLFLFLVFSSFLFVLFSLWQFLDPVIFSCEACCFLQM